MALYVVRWSGLRASLIEAHDEAHLLWTLDELADPSGCTWELYEGPLWVDFEVPAKFNVAETDRAHLKLRDVRVSVPKRDDFRWIKVVASEAETELLMREAILESAFPNLALLRDDSGDDTPSENALKAAIAQDLVDHRNQTANQGVTFDSNSSGGVDLRATRLQYFLWTASRFEPIDHEVIESFLLGERSLEASPEQKVRIASVTVALREGTPRFVSGVHWRAFGVAPNGMIVEPHKADAFPSCEDDAGEPSPFLRRRNAAVRWSPTGAEVAQLKKALIARFGKKLRVSKLPSSDLPL